MILATTPAPTVRPPSRMAKRSFSSIAIGTISVTSMAMLSPGITISVPSGSVTMIRTDSAKKLLELAEHATVPVINGLTDRTHPCQLMADIMTFEEKRGPIAGKTVAWIGDGNNVAASWIQASARFGFELRVAGPKPYWPDEKLLAAAAAAGGTVSVGEDPAKAVSGAHCVVTDTWVSMGAKDADERRKLLRPYRVDDALMRRADPDAVFMHCLPAHRGEEVSDSVIDGPQSVVWDEAENRLHVQKGILLWCLS